VLKITATLDRDRGVLLKLEGKLLEPWLPELTRACAGDPQAGPPTGVRLDLTNLTYADEPGVRTLRDLLRRGVTVAATSAFVAALLGLEDR
jgi:hypothetical protein